MSRNFPGINGLAASLRQLSLFSASRPSSAGEARLYLQRALKAAAEERYDVALVFCGKALDVEPGNLGARLLSGRLYDHARNDIDRAVEAGLVTGALLGRYMQTRTDAATSVRGR